MNARLPWILSLVWVVFYGVGLAGHLIDATLPLMLRLTPYVLYAGGALCLISAAAAGSGDALAWFAVAYLATFSAEAAGVATGWVFGPYLYGATLGPTILGVPPVIGLNWVIIVYGFTNLVRRVWEGRLGAAVIVGCCAVLLDYFIEPVAIQLDYWIWLSEGVPLQNYAAWFLIGAALSWFVPDRAGRPWFILTYLGMQVVFFVVLYLFLVR